MPPKPVSPAIKAGHAHPAPSARVTLAASTVGLLGSPLGQGPLLRAATLYPDGAAPSPAGSSVALPGEAVAQPAGRAGNDPGTPRPDPTGGAAVCAVPLLLGGGLVVAVVVAVGRARRRAAAVGRVRIVAVPPGEAPEAIRRAWVGLELPVAAGPVGEPSQGVVGVLSHRPAGCRDGYAVPGAEAVRLLAAQAPEAAAWWRRQAPHVLAAGYQLVFPAEVCERVG